MEIREKNGFSILGFIAQVLLVVIFVFVLMLLFPTKSYIEKNGTGVGTGANGNTALTELLLKIRWIVKKGGFWVCLTRKEFLYLSYFFYYYFS